MISPRDIEQLYTLFNAKETDDLWNSLNQSQSPRSPAMLYDIAEASGLNKGSNLLDVGCGWGVPACHIVERFGCQVTGIDIWPEHIAIARTRARDAGLSEQTEFLQGDILALPFEDATFDFILCRDMLEHVSRLGKAIRESTRVLKPDGKMLLKIYELTDPMLAYEDLTKFYGTALHSLVAGRSQRSMEDVLEAAGLQIETREEVNGEWEEYLEETRDAYIDPMDAEEATSAHILLRFARLNRKRDQLIAEYGQSAYDVTMGYVIWRIYCLMGRARTVVYTARKVESQRASSSCSGDLARSARG